MGLLNKKVKIKKELIGDDVKQYVDYHNQKKPKSFALQLIKELVGSSHCLVVISTDLCYKRPEIDTDAMVEQLVNYLHGCEVNHQRMETQAEEDLTVFGIALKSKEKRMITNYKIVFTLSPTQLILMEDISDYFNLQYYILIDKNREEALEYFHQVHGDMEKLNQLLDFNIYQDNFFQKLRIRHRTENTKRIEAILHGGKIGHN